MTALTLVAICCGIAGQNALRARRQRAAAQAILRSGGNVDYDYRHTDVVGGDDRSTWVLINGLTVPKWAEKVFGRDLFGCITHAQLGPDATEENISSLGIKSLKSLSFQRTYIGASMLKEICELRQLVELDLSCTRIINRSLSDLQQLTRLRQLNLDGTNLTDDGLLRLEKLKNLERLTLTGCSVTDVGVAKLRKSLPNVEITDFAFNTKSWTKSHRAAFEQLVVRPDVKVIPGLSTGSTDVRFDKAPSASDITLLRSLSGVPTLMIDHPLTVNQLRLVSNSLPNLKWFCFVRVKMKQATIQRLRGQMPNCVIQVIQRSSIP